MSCNYTYGHSVISVVYRKQLGQNKAVEKPRTGGRREGIQPQHISLCLALRVSLQAGTCKSAVLRISFNPSLGFTLRVAA